MEPRLNCNDVAASLPLFVGGDLDASAAHALGEHLAACAPCAALAEQARAARAALRSLAVSDERAPELWPGVREALAREGRLASSAGATRSERGALLRFPAPTRWASAAAVVLCVGLAWVGLRDADGGASAPAAPAAPPIAEIGADHGARTAENGRGLSPALEVQPASTAPVSTAPGGSLDVRGGRVAEGPAYPAEGLRLLQPGEERLLDTAGTQPLEVPGYEVFMHRASHGGGALAGQRTLGRPVR